MSKEFGDERATGRFDASQKRLVNCNAVDVN